MKKYKIISKDKKTWIETIYLENGSSETTGNCEICRQFPCQHIDTDIGNWNLKENIIRNEKPNK